ncbi:MAG: 3-phosphoshikimate 1-carboxyvinyltransferase [Flavobacteriaceae bacterium]|jgi:3-phosphoshikimate 1-carboxyvinyltransferase|nr:3-phosphoshikimate 1-carboxyvinyltransferase [Flavobacteriaceae bacterium]MBT3753774.1 3-phosphoshikimate 1-carboxyvinyltransferase [Flavobacteriaceae bacterium]MBT4416176.1 3-phosphoshikimate 1-carboxyvinyltransferase [Flavobacteriaceae bacterium]MBT5396261.1 3-phosphoshikimate 1-carboxyvinyltransferase [Flavobacteriaceae bacterium]MBT6689041.1 3-phosphoshikimate 1-carboxyvinyltransferase [Flavobacteriaceae bacterium]
MSFLVEHPNSKINHSFNISGSKSESNRLLILKYIFKNIKIENLSNSDDTIVLKNYLESNSNLIDVHHAGTAMRFLTAYLAIQNNNSFQITGSERMQNRPIKILVDALNILGADINYLDKIGYPPLKINGKMLLGGEISLSSEVSSQYISALMLIAPSLKNGLVISLEGSVTSRPYIEMTSSILNRVGIKSSFKENKISIQSVKLLEKSIQKVESDWSSLSYFYSIVALSKYSELNIGSYNINSIQGDKKLVEIYKNFGVQTSFSNDIITIKKIESKDLNKSLKLDLSDTPDIAQTIAVTCFGLGLSCDLNGLHTLKIKETDRLEALKVELTKMGAIVSITKDSFHLKKSSEIKSNITIETYNDHRMAMAFTPLAICKPIIINNPDVVSKSFPDFWDHLKGMNFLISKN